MIIIIINTIINIVITIINHKLLQYKSHLCTQICCEFLKSLIMLVEEWEEFKESVHTGHVLLLHCLIKLVGDKAAQFPLSLSQAIKPCLHTLSCCKNKSTL